MGTHPLLDSGKSIIFFDAHCLLCSQFIKLVLNNDRGRLYYSGFESLLAKEVLQSDLRIDPSTVIYYNAGHLLFKSEAIFAILKELRFPWPLLRIFQVLPTSVNDSIYNFIAKHRFVWFGRSETCYLPSAEQQGRFID